VACYFLASRVGDGVRRWVTPVVGLVAKVASVLLEEVAGYTFRIVDDLRSMDESHGKL
jgi:hypothetical protein